MTPGDIISDDTLWCFQPAAGAGGFGTWNGAWSDGAPEWRAVRGAIGRTGYEDRHAWSFFISMVDFVQLFSCVYVCNVLPSNWHTNTLPVRIFACATGQPGRGGEGRAAQRAHVTQGARCRQHALTTMSRARRQ